MSLPTSKKPDVAHPKVFGCRVFVHVPEEKRKKLDPKAAEAMMVGYVEGSTCCYQIWDPIGRKLIIIRDVIFEEQSTMEPIGSQTATKEQDYYSILLTAEDQLQIEMEADPMDQGEVAPPDGPPLL